MISSNSGAMNTPENIIISMMTGFIHYLRERQFTIGINENIDSQNLAKRIGVTNKRYLKNGLKSLLCQSAEDWQRFDQFFHDYWQPTKRQQSVVSTIGGKAPRSKSIAEMSQSGNRESQFDLSDSESNQQDVSDNKNDNDNKVSQAAASARTSLTNKSFKHLDNTAEIRKVHTLCEHLAKKIKKRLLRRHKNYHQGRQIDIRRTLRNNLCYGGRPIALTFKKRRKQTPKVVLLLDVSRSMSIYSYLFLRFAHGMLNVFKQADAFAFHTKLIRISETLREPNQHKLAEKMELVSYGFGGGTKIDESLKTFNQQYAPKLLGSKTIIIILSDGYDTGEPEDLCEQIKRIKQRVRKLIWLNPLLGQAHYEPKTRSMQAALPLIDVFAPANNLSSLAKLEHHLGR
jgi:uncharacterized protein with von Willebrand factor type A (vWA) domain